MNWFGRLDWTAIEHDWILMGVTYSIIAVAVIVNFLLFYFNGWSGLWNKWITTADHKRIGIMYMVVSLLMLFKGVVDGFMMRSHLAMSAGDSFGYLTPNHFQQIFTAHGTTMIFFVGMGVIFGLLNLIVPLQIGARDVAFPFMNSLSFWLFAVGAALVNLSLMVGKFSIAGWTGYTPLSGLEYSPDVGVDYWIWSIQISGIGSLMSGINFLVTILKMRAPGMTLMKMPLFTWSAMTSMILVVFAFPILTVTLLLLTLDRTIGTHFFTVTDGGNSMLYVNLIWAWGHPEVYILMLPGFGIFSEVVSALSRKRLFGYTSMIWALGAITFLSFIVWLHHFFTMGAGANVNAFFGIMTMLIAVPTGVKVFNWLFTMYRGRVQLKTPMLWFLAFVFTFTTGGMTGVLLSVPPADFQFHNSLFLIAHFHSMVIGGVLFAFFSGYSYWFSKVFGFKLNERLGVIAFWLWFIGFQVAFMPLYVMGLMGASRRIDHYEILGWQPFYIAVFIGVLIIIAGVVVQNWQLLYSILTRDQNRDKTGDPWDAGTLEWATASPPPFYNFAHIPHVHTREAFWQIKSEGIWPEPLGHYTDIHMPKNTAMGFYIAICSFLMGFGIIWYMWWLAALGFFGIIALLILRFSQDHLEYTVSAEEIRQIEIAIRNRYA